jgi:hypothetical protein
MALPYNTRITERQIMASFFRNSRRVDNAQ